ncbi:hypothetical protein P3T20_007385 [Paraburkholderia sp. GAS206C]
MSAKSAMGKPKLKVLADRGYFSGPDIRACKLAGIKAYVPKPLTSASRKKGLFTKRDFVYVARNDEYRCLADHGQQIAHIQKEMHAVDAGTPAL